MSSGALPKLPVSSSLVAVVPRTIIRSPRPQPGKSVFSGPKRVLQHYPPQHRTFVDIEVPSSLAPFVRVSDVHASWCGPVVRVAISKRNSAVTDALTRMEGVLRKPAVIAAIVATISIATMLLVNHTNLIVDRRPPHTPPGTTFNAVNDAGAEIAPSQPESPIKLPSVGPTPVDHPPVRTK